MPDDGEAMLSDSEAVILRVLSGIGEVSKVAWNACAGDTNPFAGHDFLCALEDSGSASAETGWKPQHLALDGPDGALRGIVPLYLKSHSYGEYVFDWAWADAYERAGGRYYPKLQACVPFTPVTGPRLLASPGADSDAVRSTLAAGLRELAERAKVSSLHVTFPTQVECETLRAAGFLIRQGRQYRFENPGYASFDEFLSALTSRKRKTIRKERAKVAASGISIRCLTGDEIEPRHWDAFCDFYMTTADRKWGHPYLTRDFFHRLGGTMADRVVLVMAEDRGELVAGALNLIGADTLYGRNWGCLGDYRLLHFEVCYYQAIDFAIARGLKYVEAGAQGEHKIQRGYLPVETYSAHWIADSGFRDAVANFLDQERRQVKAEMSLLANYGPFRQGEGN